MNKIKTWIIVIFVFIIVSGLLFGGGVLLGYKLSENSAKPPDTPGKPSVVVKNNKGSDYPIEVHNLKFYTEHLLFTAEYAGPGSSDVWIERPDKWMPAKNIIKVGLGGGYNSNCWLPGGTFGYYRYVGSLYKFSTYIGPEIYINAIDKNHISINAYATALFLF